MANGASAASALAPRIRIDLQSPRASTSVPRAIAERATTHSKPAVRAKARQACPGKAHNLRRAAHQWHAKQKPTYKSAKHAEEVLSTLERYAFPVFGEADVSAIDTDLIVKALEPHWSRVPATASRLRGRIEAVLDWATVAKLRPQAIIRLAGTAIWSTCCRHPPSLQGTAKARGIMRPCPMLSFRTFGGSFHPPGRSGFCAAVPHPYGHAMGAMYRFLKPTTNLPPEEDKWDVRNRAARQAAQEDDDEQGGPREGAKEDARADQRDTTPETRDRAPGRERSLSTSITDRQIAAWKLPWKPGRPKVIGAEDSS